MDVDINILDSFPSIEKLIKNNNIFLEINYLEYNLNKLINNNELVKLSKISNKIIFKIYIEKKQLFGTNIFKIDKFKDLFSLDGKSYILWLEFKKEIKNEIDEYNLVFYNMIRLKVKFTPLISINDLIIKKNSSNSNNEVDYNYTNNIKTIINNIYNNSLPNDKYLINENAHFNIDTNDVFCLSSSNFYKKKFQDEFLCNITEDNLNGNKNNNLNNKNRSIKKFKSSSSNSKKKDIKALNNFNNRINKLQFSNNNENKSKTKSKNKNKISSKTPNNLMKSVNNYIITENDDHLNNSYKFSKILNKSLPKKIYVFDNNKNNSNKKRNNKTPNKIHFRIGEIIPIRKESTINNSKKVSDENISTTIITNQNNIKQNIIVNLNASYNKNNFKSLRNKNSKENEMNLNLNNKDNNSEKNIKSFNISKPLKLINNNFINEEYNDRYEQEQNEINGFVDKSNNNFKDDLNDKILLEEKNKKNKDNESNENTQLINNISIINNSINQNNNEISFINNNLDEIQNNFLLDEIFLDETDIFKEFNSIKNNFELLYSKSFINNIKKDLINLEFSLALEKIIELFNCYNEDVEFLFYKNQILINLLKNFETKIKCMQKKIYKLNGKKEEIKLKQNRLLFLKESEFHFIEDIKMQKITQKKILETLIQSKNNKNQKFKNIFKEIIKKRQNIFNIRKNSLTNNMNTKLNNNIYKTNTERSLFNKGIQKNNNIILKNFNIENNYNHHRFNKNNYNMKTPKIKKEMKKYKINSLSTNRFSAIKYNNLLSPRKVFKSNINIGTKTSGSYCFTNGNINNFSSKNKFNK